MSNNEANGDIHGECAAEIRRLEQWQNEAAATLATFIGLSSRPDEFEWSKVAIKVPALLADEGAYKTDSELQIDRAEAKDQLDACHPYLKEGETPAECLARNRADIARLMGKWGVEKMTTARLRTALDKIAQTTGSDDPCRPLVQIARDALKDSQKENV